MPSVAGLASASLVDAVGRLYSHRAHIMGLVSPRPDLVLFGPAVTISFLPYRQDLEDVNGPAFADWFYRAVGSNPQGKVLVMTHGGYPDASHGGGTKLSRVRNNELAGVLTDGRLRDFDQLAEWGFATFCGGEATRWGGDTVTPAAANVPVEIGGVRIVPEDYVFADRAGAVVIPGGSVNEAIAIAREIEREENAALVSIREEDRPSR
ncbi:RraA family protein [Amycolatopsis sp. FDAARGOS 1241]|nr:RraA family protein [Amycolatopsis sp. FDAARGOS 1241]